MVQAADLRQLADLALFGRLNPAMVGRVHVKRPVDPPVMIVVHLGLQHALHMPLVEHEDMREPMAAGPRSAHTQRGITSCARSRIDADTFSCGRPGKFIRQTR